jgi:hypothetical protein
MGTETGVICTCCSSHTNGDPGIINGGRPNLRRTDFGDLFCSLQTVNLLHRSLCSRISSPAVSTTLSVAVHFVYGGPTPWLRLCMPGSTVTSGASWAPWIRPWSHIRWPSVAQTEDKCSSIGLCHLYLWSRHAL